MNVKNCKKCGNIFMFDGFDICQKCRRIREEEFQLVKNYLREHPKATIIEVEAETKVSVDSIEQFLREGRLEISKDSPIFLKCLRCGENNISSGKYCNKCLLELKEELNSVAGNIYEDISTATQREIDNILMNIEKWKK